MPLAFQVITFEVSTLWAIESAQFIRDVENYLDLLERVLARF
jgi:hypothetical protein